MHIQAYSQSYTYIEAYLPTLGFRHIQDPGITGSNNVKQHLLFKSGSSFKSQHFSHFVSKVNIQHLFLQHSISIITMTIIIACHPR